MTERKPPFVGFETWIDKKIREAADRGDFEDLPGTGKPLPDLNKPYDEMWWVKQKMQREGLSTEALLPAPLQLRKEIERLPETVRDLPTERDVRDLAEELNLRIVHWLRAPSGPQVRIGPINVEHLLDRWRADRQAAVRRTAEAVRSGTVPDETPSPRVRWWRRMARRLWKSA